MKISVIVPVYNTEKYVGRCIDSIVSQIYSDWELILVDDGSTDGSLDILKTYTMKEPRIRVIHQENSGPGIARNLGIEQATGEYIVFVDSDDVIKPDYFEKLSRETADVVFIDIDRIDESYHMFRKEYMSNYQFFSKDKVLRCQMTGKILWGGVRKAVKSELLLKHQIRFTEHKVGEEAVYSFLLMYYAESVSFIKGSVYEYVNRSGSQSDTESDDPWGSVATALKEKVLQMGLYNRYANTINAFMVTAAIVSLDKMVGKYKWDEYKSKAKECIEKYKKKIDYNQSVDINHMNNAAKILYPFFKAGLIMPIYIASYTNKLKKQISKLYFCIGKNEYK